MNTIQSPTELNARISSFLVRKQAEFPELSALRKRNLYTAKYAARLRSRGQLTLSE